MKTFKLLSTDYYQLSMTVAYLLLDQHNDKAGFEAFYRRTNPNINRDGDFYFFSGEANVRKLVDTVRVELRDPELLETLLILVRPKLPRDNAEEYEAIIRDRWGSLDKDFVVNVYPEGVMVKPFVPVVQYYGSKVIGQLLETPITNAINGYTGLLTQKKVNNNSKLSGLFSAKNNDLKTNYIMALEKRAREYRESTSKVLLEAGFRRAPNYSSALLASKVALQEGWDGTSNTSILFETELPQDLVGGTMAHSFIMSQESELDAYKLWDSVYPNSTLLIDTYDTLEGIKMLTANNIKPACVRIDSGDLKSWAFLVRNLLNKKGWKDVEIFLSGDLTPSILNDFELLNVPFDRCMAGTEYVNIFGSNTINSGFVYKLVELNRGGIKYYPEKKSKGKISYSGLKNVEFTNDGTVIVKSKKKTFGYINSELSNKTDKFIFAE